MTENIFNNNYHLHQHHSRRRVISTVIISLLVACVSVGGALLIGHQRLVATCSETMKSYQQQAEQLQQLLDDNADALDITTDDVLDENKSVVNDFQTAYKQAEEELANAPSDDQCASGQNSDGLKSATAELASATLTLSDLYYQVDNGVENVQLANQIKLLADARLALKCRWRPMLWKLTTWTIFRTLATSWTKLLTKLTISCWRQIRSCWI